MIERSSLPNTSRNEGIVASYKNLFEEQYLDELQHLSNLRGNTHSLLIDLDDVEEAGLIESLYTQTDKILNNANIAAEELYEETVESNASIDITVRFENPSDGQILGIREIRDENVGDFISLQGIVSQHIEVKPKIELGVFRCLKCQSLTEKHQPAENLIKPFSCDNEECSNTTASNFVVEYEQSNTINFQKIRVQESPNGLEGGEDPQTIDVLLRGDSTGKITGGEKVTVSGVLRTTESQDSSVLNTYVDGNFLEKEDKGTEDMKISSEEEERIIELSERDDIYDVLCESIAPSIKGHTTAKKGAMFQAFGGVRKSFRDSDSKSRGDIHVLYVGDPGVGKSKILQYINSVSTSGVYTSGKGSSAAGLCVGGDTIIQYNGELITIKELVDEHIEGSVENPTAVQSEFETVAFNGDQTNAQTASHIWKMPEQTAVTFNTQSGRELTVSPQTPLLVATENGVEWIESSEITEGSHIASPSSINYQQSSPVPIEYFDFDKENIDLNTESREKLQELLKSQYGSLRDSALDLDLSEDFIHTTLPNRPISFSQLNMILNATETDITDLTVDGIELQKGDRQEVPTQFSPDLMWLIGLIFGDGSISTDGSKHTIQISNSDTSVLQNAIQVFESEFGVSPQIEFSTDNSQLPEICVSSETIVTFLQNVGMDTLPKKDLQLESRLALSEYRSDFLQGYFDAEGEVNTRSSGHSGSLISVSSVSEPFIRQVQTLLLYEGVDSSIRKRDCEGVTNMCKDGRTVTSNYDQFELNIRHSDLNQFKNSVGFSIIEKVKALTQVCESIDSQFSSTIPGVIEQDNGTVLELGQDTIESQDVEQNLRWNLVTDVSVSTEELYDLTTVQSNFIANDFVVHNTASAVRDADFGGNDQWTLKAGAMVISDKGTACIDELDKMKDSDRSSMHEALEQQQVSVSKAGINATLKSRCSLLAAANPIQGRFDDYEPIPKQIDLEPALVSRFDLIFIIQDEPDTENDTEISNHILDRQQVGQRNARLEHNGQELEGSDGDETAEVSKSLMQKYIAYAKRNVFPTMTDETKQKIQDYYLDIRSSSDSDAVPITARKLEALVRLTEASARIRLSETAELIDAQNAIEITNDHLQEVGVDPETGELDADTLETNTTMSQRKKRKLIHETIEKIVEEKAADDEFTEPPNATIEEICDHLENTKIDEEYITEVIQKDGRDGTLYSPGSTDGYAIM